METSSKDLNTLFVEFEGNSADFSRRPSNESTLSLNVPLCDSINTRFEREDTPQVKSTTLPSLPDKGRSKSLYTLHRQKSSVYDVEMHLNGIEESPRDTETSQYRRGSLPFEKPNPKSSASVKDAFGPQCYDDSQMTLPGTPLPSLVQDSGEEFTELSTPVTPLEKEKVADPESLFFRDGRRKIDMVLVYEEEELGVMTEVEAKRRDKRKIFQENLMKEGLELELEHKDLSFDGKTWFLKIHLPWKTKTRYAAVMNMKLPIKRFITISVKAWDDKKDQSITDTIYSKWQKRWKDFFEYDHDLISQEPSFYDATEGGDREEQFVVKDRVTSYSSAQRSLIVMQILLRVKFDETDKVGIRRLLNDSTYIACFPLHEGRWNKEASDGKLLDRRLLYLEWARPGRWMKRQPLHLVRKYFGDKIALYFCWLGFYTKMLFAPAIVGTLCFLYGIFTIDGDDNIPTKEICDINIAGNITLCPMCDKACKYQKLKDSCKFARLTYLFDNPATVFFAIFMSLWATVFLELWRRKQSVIQWEWDLHGTEQDEEPRPEFETSVKTFRTNPVTRDKEPYLPTWSKAVRLAATGSVVFFMFYHRIAIYLTNLESPRTQTEYEDSYTFKIFLFEFMNFYSSLIYIAFFKGRFFEYPGDTVSRRSEFFRVKGDICDPAGCLSELCIQLSIIMIGKQVFNNFVELFNPAFSNWWRRRSHRSNTKDLSRKHTRWEEDYHLQDPGRLALFDEYLEMILQYGFVTLFVAAFPLAPLCALLNNIAEIRLDAYKMVTQARRPLAERVEDIGAWYGILRAITYAAVVSNGFVIAYTSDFIPRLVYQFKYSPTDDLTGYIDASLSMFNTSDYREDMRGDDENPPEMCQYRGYRNGPNETDPYGLSPQYWHVFAARLAFVVIFEHVVFALVGIMQYVIPDVPSELKTQMQRESLLAKEAKYEHGLKKNEYDYDELLQAFRENNNASRSDTRVGIKGSWARRLSRLSDGLDAHVEVISRKKNSVENTVWEASY
ncbi:anoctamin-4 isoform X2 [Leptinotarsa decemlineata]|uniref:anoctamin-4 isoform X2 n=1 Tax=Leptinotarsa decemlineata TaxID=7539 RepID=UPI003D304CF1